MSQYSDLSSVGVGAMLQQQNLNGCVYTSWHIVCGFDNTMTPEL